MAIMKRAETSLTLPLCHHTRVGRSSDADIRIDDRRISSEHAVIAWDNGIWVAKDLGSRNGTVIDGKRLEPGARVPLKTGAALRFGSSEELWTLESEDAPDVVAIEVGTDHFVEGEHGLVALSQSATVLTENGNDYWLERAGKRTKISDRQVLDVDGKNWRVLLPPQEDQAGRTVTADGILLTRDITLQFHVSPDEENIEIRILSEGVTKPLRARSFDYMLLALARARIDDAGTDLALDEQGWVYTDELAKSLGMDVSHVNVDIYRARRRFAKAGIQGADEMLQRRTQTRALRLGCGKVEVV